MINNSLEDNGMLAFSVVLRVRVVSWCDRDMCVIFGTCTHPIPFAAEPSTVSRRRVQLGTQTKRWRRSSASLTSHTIKHTVAILTPKIQLTDLYSNGSIPSQLNGKIDSRLQWLSPVCCFAPQMWLNKFHHYSSVRCDIQKYAYATQHLEMVEGIRPKHWPLWSI